MYIYISRIYFAVIICPCPTITQNWAPARDFLNTVYHNKQMNGNFGVFDAETLYKHLSKYQTGFTRCLTILRIIPVEWNYITASAVIILVRAIVEFVS